MIWVAACRSDGTKLKMNAQVNSMEDAWVLLHTERRGEKVPTSALVAIQLSTSKEASGGLRVVKSAKKGRK